EELYHAALGLSPEERAAFLSRCCNGNDTLRGEIESLLSASDRADAGDFLQGETRETTPQPRRPKNRARQVGKLVGRYHLVGLVGAGGMGEVYRALDPRLEREVAIKILPAHLAGDPAALIRFKREARAIASLSHPNILALHDFDADGEL